MSEFTHESMIEAGLEEVFGWHERPGAFVRLTPPSLGRVEQEPTDGIRDGSTSVLRTWIPGTVGKVGLRWVARHHGYVKNVKFEDTMESGPFKSWTHRHLFDGDQRSTTIRDEIAFELPVPTIPGVHRLADRIAAGMLRRVFDYRNRQLAGDLAFHAAHPGAKRIAVTGATGTVGTQLVALLGGGGHDVRRVTRGERDDPSDIHWDPETGELNPDDLRDIDVVIHLAGEPIAGRFSYEHMREVLNSRRESTSLIAGALATIADDGTPRALVSASAAGYYGPDRGDELLTEESAAGSGFLAGVCRAWEDACEPARQAGVRVVNVRTGIVQSADGGQLGLQAPMFRLGLGGPLGSGDQWMPWIAIDDLIGIYAHAALEPGIEGPVNAVAPGIVRNSEYAKALGHVLHRPAVIPVPKIGPQLVLGTVGAEEFALAGQHMSSQLITDAGYEFRFPELEPALRHVLAL